MRSIVSSCLLFALFARAITRVSGCVKKKLKKISPSVAEEAFHSAVRKFSAQYVGIRPCPSALIETRTSEFGSICSNIHQLCVGDARSLIFTRDEYVSQMRPRMHRTRPVASAIFADTSANNTPSPVNWRERDCFGGTIGFFFFLSLKDYSALISG